MKNLLIRLNNWWVRRKRFRLPPDNILLICPRCLQNSRCGQSIITDPNECRRCGDCDVADLVALAGKYGVKLVFVTGGEIALELVRQPAIKAVVTVACERELLQGLLRKGLKPVLAVVIARPHGPCRDTSVHIPVAESAVRFFLDSKRSVEDAPYLTV